MSTQHSIRRPDHPSSREPQARSAPRPAHPTATATVPAPAHTHTHAWRTESSHPTSEGLVSYARCGRCGERRVELRRLSPEPAPLSQPVARRALP